MSSKLSRDARQSLVKDHELSKISWFACLDEDQRDIIRQQLFVIDLPRGSFVCQRGDPSKNWFGLIEGLLKAGIETEDGEAITYTGLGPGGWFGEGTILKLETFGYHVQTLRASSIAYLPAEAFHWLLANSPSFCRFIMDLMNERLAQLMSTVEADRVLAPEDRVALTLKRLINPILFPLTGNELHITQQELSCLAGLSRQRVNRALQQLQEEGIILINYGTIMVLKPEQLHSRKRRSAAPARCVRAIHAHA